MSPLTGRPVGGNGHTGCAVQDCPLFRMLPDRHPDPAQQYLGPGSCSDHLRHRWSGTSRRYGWWFTHAVRALIYGKIVYPKMRDQGREIWNAGWRPRHMHFMMTTYKEHRSITEKVVRSILREIRASGVPGTIWLGSSDRFDEDIIEDFLRREAKDTDITLRIIRQSTYQASGPPSGLCCAPCAGCRSIRMTWSSSWTGISFWQKAPSVAACRCSSCIRNPAGLHYG